MIGAFVLVPGIISFTVTTVLGLILTLAGFAACRKKQSRAEAAKIWILTAATALIIAAITLFLTVHVSSSGSPTEEQYQQMATALALWLAVPGAALAAGGTALFILCGKSRNIPDPAANH